MLLQPWTVTKKPFPPLISSNFSTLRTNTSLKHQASSWPIHKAPLASAPVFMIILVIFPFFFFKLLVPSTLDIILIKHAYYFFPIAKVGIEGFQSFILKPCPQDSYYRCIFQAVLTLQLGQTSLKSPKVLSWRKLKSYGLPDTTLFRKSWRKISENI